MILTYQECIEKYGSDYKIKKEIENRNLFMMEKGVYSTEKIAPELDIILNKYPKTVCTGPSAFYYHGLTEVIPDYYYLATKRNDTRIKDLRVKQSFLKDDIFEPGTIEIEYNNSTVRLYGKERMIIELMRFKSRTPNDYYKEIIRNYRKLVNELDFRLVEDYAALFPNGSKYMDMIEIEVL